MPRDESVRDKLPGFRTLFDLVMFPLTSIGLVYALMTSLPEQVGRRVLVMPAAGLGFLMALVLIASSMPPAWPAVLAGMLFVCVLRHAIWPATEFSRLIGHSVLWWLPGRDSGRAMCGFLGILFGGILAENPGPWQGVGLYLVVGGAGSLVLFCTIRARERQQAMDARDALWLARRRAADAGL